MISIHSRWVRFCFIRKREAYAVLLVMRHKPHLTIKNVPQEAARGDLYWGMGSANKLTARGCPVGTDTAKETKTRLLAGQSFYYLWSVKPDAVDHKLFAFVGKKPVSRSAEFPAGEFVGEKSPAGKSIGMCPFISYIHLEGFIVAKEPQFYRPSKLSRSELLRFSTFTTRSSFSDSLLYSAF